MSFEEEPQEQHHPEYMSLSETLVLTIEQATNGLSQILGDKIIAQWILKKIDQSRNVKEDQLETITLKELLQFYIELFLGKLDY